MTQLAVQPSPTDFPSAGYVRLPQVLSVIPIGTTTWWRWVREGKAPKAIKLGARTTAWKAQDILSLIDQLAEEQL